MEKRIKDSSFSSEIEELKTYKLKLGNESSKILFIVFLSFINLSLYSFIYKLVIKEKDLMILEFLSFMLTIFLVILGIYKIYKFSKIRDKGMIIYEEIGNEIDWSKQRKKFIHRPPIELRITIREFLKSTDLPFTNGKSGQIYYIIILISISLFNVIIKLFLQ